MAKGSLTFLFQKLIACNTLYDHSLKKAPSPGTRQSSHLQVTFNANKFKLWKRLYERLSESKLLQCSDYSTEVVILVLVLVLDTASLRRRFILLA